MDRFYKSTVSELWRDLDEINKLIVESLKGNYSGNFFGYTQESLIVIAFIKKKPHSEKEGFVNKLENIADYYRIKGNMEMAEHYSDSIDFFRRELMRI